MAYCEKCGKTGYKTTEVFPDETRETFLGPCCGTRPAPVVSIVPPDESQDLAYGLEVSSRGGVRAFASYGGLKVNFSRRPDEIKAWAQKNGLIDQHAG